MINKKRASKRSNDYKKIYSRIFVAEKRSSEKKGK